MPSPEVRTYEGQDLESVLAEVFKDLGDDATIVSADRRRKGGVGGFFSREVVEVVARRNGAVAQPRPDLPADAPATLAAATTLLDLADATSAAERGTSVLPGGSLSDGGDDLFVALAKSLGGMPAPQPAAPAGFADLFARAQDLTPEEAGSMVVPEVEALSAHLRNEAGPAPTPESMPESMPERVSNRIPEPPARVRPAFTELPRVSRAEVEVAGERPTRTRAAGSTRTKALASGQGGLRPRLAPRAAAAVAPAVVVPTEATPQREIVIGAAAMVVAETAAPPVLVDEPVVMQDPEVVADDGATEAQPLWLSEPAEALRSHVRVPKRRVTRRVARPAAEAAMPVVPAPSAVEPVAVELAPVEGDAPAVSGMPLFARAASLRAAAAREAANAPVASIPVAVRAAAMRAAAMREHAEARIPAVPVRSTWSIDPSSSIARMVALGVPARTAAQAVATGDLAGALGSLPTTSMPDQGVVVVAGAESAAIVAARRMARELLGDGEDILVAQATCPRGVAAWRWISDTAEVAAQQPRWADRSRPVIIALPLPTDGEDATWAAAMAAALRPVALHLVVDASASAGDMAARVASMAPVQALHVVGAAAAAAPATALGTGVAVATVDGVESSPERWADLLEQKVG